MLVNSLRNLCVLSVSYAKVLVVVINRRDAEAAEVARKELTVPTAHDSALCPHSLGVEDMIGVLISAALFVTLVWSQTPSQTTAEPKTEKRTNPEVLKKYTGRYELEVGIIPISTLDVSLESNELWLKPSVVKKRRLLHKSRTVFIDEVAGTPCTFNKDEDGKIVSLTFEYEGANYTATKVTLPPPSLKGNTTFRLKGYLKADLVILAGTFNNWNQSQFVFAREGDEWVCRIDLEPGKYAYKFIVDGNWILDPSNSVTEEDAAGNVNSVLVVPQK